MRVVLAEDSVLLREGIARVLTDAGIEVVGQTGDAAGLMDLVAALHPDVAVVDVRMPPTHTTEGLVAAREIRTSFGGVGVLVLSQYVETRHAMQLLADGGAGPGGIGYLLKDRVSDVGEFVDAVRRVGAGGSAIDSVVVAAVLGRKRRDDPLDALTGREREVLALMAEGRSNQGIGKELFLSEKTIETHVSSIFSKLGLPTTGDEHRRVHAVLTYVRSLSDAAEPREM